VAPAAAPSVARGRRSWAGPTREERVEVGWAGRKPRPGGEGGRWLGLGEGGGPREEEGEWAGGRSHEPDGKEGGRAEIVAQAEIQGSKRKINFN
jgi:hypothetical protein